MSDDKRQSIMRKISAMLSKAESTTFGEERDALLVKVDALMVEYAINEWELEKGGEVRADPVTGQFDVCEKGNSTYYELAQLAGICLKFWNCKGVFDGLDGQGKRWPVVAITVGFPDDLRNAELMYNSLRLQMAMDISPKYDPNKCLEENVAAFKEAGWKWEDIWNEWWKAGSVHTDRAEQNRSKMLGWQRKYKVWAEARGIKPTMGNPASLQSNYALGFVAAINSRVMEIIRTRTQHEQPTGTSTALVLADRSDRVEALYNEQWGSGTGTVKKSRTMDSQAFKRGHASGKRADLGGSRIASKRTELGR